MEPGESNPTELFTNDTGDFRNSKGLGGSDYTGYSYKQDDRHGLRKRGTRFVRRKWEGGVMHMSTPGTA
jgi:hypothetical protein